MTINFSVLCILHDADGEKQAKNNNNNRDKISVGKLKKRASTPCWRQRRLTEKVVMDGETASANSIERGGVGKKKTSKRKKKKCATAV